MSAPLFSVVTPNFNSGAKLATTIESVLSQEPGLYEYLVMDGGSTDGSVEYLRAHTSTLRWVSERDAGIYDAMNKGLQLATGQFLYFLGAGDRLLPGALRDVADRLPSEANDRCFIYGDVHWPRVGRYGGVVDAFRLAEKNICHQGIFYGRRIFEMIGRYDPRYKTCADYALNILCFADPSIRKIYVDVVIADFEGGGASEDLDQAFYADLTGLVRRHLGWRTAVVAAYHHSDYFAWMRWLNYHLHKPWHTLPGRVWRLVRRLFSNAP